MPAAKAPPRPPALRTIPPWRPFVDDLAAGMLAMWGEPTALARAVVLLPNRRAMRTLTDAFVRRAEGRALLLPRLSPVGDIDSDQAFGAFAEGLERPEDLPREIAPLPRQVALMRFVHRGDGPDGGRPAADSFQLAGQLAAALDALEIERKRAVDLRRIDPASQDLQQHWQRNLKVLELIAARWPGVLAERGQIDATHRRNLLLDALAKRWARNAPAHPVILAGFASAPPAVMALARVVARLPQGMVVFPGLDTGIDADEWDFVHGCDTGGPCETHPQHGMARILDTIGAGLGDVQPWPHAAGDVLSSPPERAAIVSHALKPAERSGAFPPVTPCDGCFDGVQFLEAATQCEEGFAVAIAMRQAANHPGRTAALVTSDRALAQRVRVQLERFGIGVDDSAGEPLAMRAAGSFVVAIAEALADRFAPVPLLAMLKHPLAGRAAEAERSGSERAEWLAQARLLDRLALRGLRPPPGLNGVNRRLVRLLSDDGAAEARLSPADRARIGPLLAWWTESATPPLAELDALAAAPRIAADALLGALRRAAEALAGPALWAGPDGRCLARLFEELDDCRGDLAAVQVRPEEAPALLTGLLSGFTIRPSLARHPQLSILSPLEARLQRADLLILGGLNEGSWPGAPAPDPWLAPAIRREMGLPGLPRRIGLQAHDFVAALGAPEVLLTRSVRLENAPSVPSRFWQRLRALAPPRPAAGPLLPSADRLLAAARTLDRHLTLPPMPRPAPAPPADARPRRLSVTEVAMLKADPFAFYARHMLKLRPLEPLDADPTAADRGIAVHHILERWFGDPAVRARGLDALIDAELKRLGDRPDLDALWKPRVRRMADWALAQSEADAAEGWRLAKVEASGGIDFAGVRLTGRADRIDRGPDGYRVIDFKTGAVPPPGKVNTLFDTQLALLAVMLAEGGMRGLPPGPVAALLYWKLGGGREAGFARPARGKRLDGPANTAEHIAAAAADARALFGGYLTGDRPFEAKLHARFAGGYTDYDQLARLAEWLGQRA